MPEWKILNRAEKQSIIELMKVQWAYDSDFAYEMLRTPKDKIYIVTRSVIEADLSGLRVDRLGVYFGELVKGELRLSIEGSQIIGPHASKRIAEIPDGKVKHWLTGQDLDVSEDASGFQIVKNKNDYMGSGKASNGTLYNYVPKNRRIGTTE